MGHVELVGTRFEVLERLANAPGGPLLRVRDRLRGAEMAMRLLPASEVPPAAFDGFQQLFADLSRLDHPHLARVFDFGHTQSAVFYTRELGPMQSLLEALPIGDEHAVVQSLVGLTDGLAALHASGLVHGLATADYLRLSLAGSRLGVACVTDPGFHRLLPWQHRSTRRGYLPPEVTAGADVSPASDLYELGATFLEALGGQEALTLLASGRPRPFRTAIRKLDRHLIDLLDRLVAQDPRERPASGLEVLRMMRDPGWALPPRAAPAEQFLSPLLVGREQELAGLVALMRRAARGEAHAGEVVGAPGSGRSRLLTELATVAASEGWIVVPVDPTSAVDGVGELAHKIKQALGAPQSQATPTSLPPSAPLDQPSETPRFAQLAAMVRAAIEEARGRLLLVADSAERLPADVVAALRYLVTETGSSPILVVASGLDSLELPHAETVRLEPLGETALRRLLAPLLTEIVNPEPAFKALTGAAGGNPLWVGLVLTEWLRSGRVRFLHGRPVFDEQAAADIPTSIAAAVHRIVSDLEPAERELVEALAVWGKPIPALEAERLVRGRVVPSQLLVTTDAAGSLRLAADTFGAVVLEGLSGERRRYWHQAILAALEGEEVSPGERAVHLLGAGRTADAVRDLLAGARRAEHISAHRLALDYFRQALANLSALDAGEVDQPSLTLRAAQLGIRIGELPWAREVLDHLDRLDLPVAAGESGIRLRFEILLARANVRREQRLPAEAAPVYAAARALLARAARVSPFRTELLRLDIDEATNDGVGGRWEMGEKRLEPAMVQLRAEGPLELLALAMSRMAVLRGESGDAKGAAIYLLRAARVARRAGDHEFAARALTNLGFFYHRLGRGARALRALDRCRHHLALCPHDGLAASEGVHRGNVLLSLGRFEEAEKALLQAQIIRMRAGERGQLPPLLIELGRLRRHTGRLEEAEQCYAQAVAIAEELNLPAVHTGRANLGELLLHWGEFRESERLMQLSLADPRPEHRGLSLLNLGTLLRRQRKFRPALEVLSEASATLARHVPGLEPLARIQTARVHLELGDVEAAELHLEGLKAAADRLDAEGRANYHLVQGLVLIHRRREPYPVFNRALEAARQCGDPTFLAEILIEALGAALEETGVDQTWLRQGLRALEQAAARTDVRRVAEELRGLRGEIAIRCRETAPDPPPAGDLTPGGLDAQASSLKDSSLDALVERLIQGSSGAAGALVVVAGLTAEGRLKVGPALKTLVPEAEGVRPYRAQAREFDRRVFRQALEVTGGNVPRAARLLRLPLSTFRYRARKLGLLRPSGDVMSENG
jgi:tetratricopeptide (TPR) repeat protein